MPASIIVRQIIQLAKEQGLSQIKLAKKTGITAAALSRLKKSDDAAISTIEKLAQATGYRLTLVPDNDLAESILKGDLL